MCLCLRVFVRACVRAREREGTNLSSVPDGERNFVVLKC